MKFTWTLTGHDYTLKNESSTSIILEYSAFNFKFFFCNPLYKKYLYTF